MAPIWTLTPVADRTGLRYSGPEVEWEPRQQPFGAGSDPSNIVDAGYAVGSIQIPGGKEPIVLHRDAVSGGGYAMVATVISADMDLLARSAPGTKTRFRSGGHGRGTGSQGAAAVPARQVMGRRGLTKSAGRLLSFAIASCMVPMHLRPVRPAASEVRRTRDIDVTCITS